MLLFLETPCLVAAVRRCMEWIPIKKSSTCWLIVGPYQSILAKAIKTGFIAARRKYLSIYFVLSSQIEKTQAEKNIYLKKVTQKLCRILHEFSRVQHILWATFSDLKINFLFLLCPMVLMSCFLLVTRQSYLMKSSLRTVILITKVTLCKSQDV